MNMLDGVSAIVLAGYLGMVLLNGKLDALLIELKKEIGYVEIAVAFFVVREMMKFPATSDLSKWFVVIGVTGAVLKLASVIPSTLLSDFASGKIDLFAFANEIAKRAGQEFNPARAITGN